jgi:hypothetical protein
MVQGKVGKNEGNYARAVDINVDGTEVRRNVWVVAALKLGSHN